MKKLTKRLTFAIVILAFAASAGGLFIHSLYRDTAIFKTAWLANDLVTLLLLPLLIISWTYSIKGNLEAYLVWLGMLLYLLYNYAFYLFGAVFNSFFILYVLIVTLSLYALIVGLFNVDIKAIKDRMISLRRRRTIIAFLIVVAIPLSMVELGQCLEFLISEKQPEIPVLVMALDLTLIIPNCILAAVLLWKNNAWGIVVSAMLLAKSFSYGLVLVTATTYIAVNDVGGPDQLLPFYIFVAGGGLICLCVLFKGLKRQRAQNLKL